MQTPGKSDNADLAESSMMKCDDVEEIAPPVNGLHKKYCSQLSNDVRQVTSAITTVQRELRALKKSECIIKHRLRWLLLKKLQLPFKKHCRLSSEREGMVNVCT